jgi:hypothetical protein
MLVDSGEDVDQRWQKRYVHMLVYLSRNTFPLKVATSHGSQQLSTGECRFDRNSIGEMGGFGCASGVPEARAGRLILVAHPEVINTIEARGSFNEQ